MIDLFTPLPSLIHLLTDVSGFWGKAEEKKASRSEKRRCFSQLVLLLQTPQTGCLEQHISISHNSGDRESQIRVLASFFLVRAFFVGCGQPCSHCVLQIWHFLQSMWEDREMAPPLLIGALIPSWSFHPPDLKSKSNYLPKILPQNIVTLGVCVSAQEFWGTQIISP